MSQRKQRKPKDRKPRVVPGVQQMVGTPPRIVDGKTTWRVGFNNQDAKGALEELIRSHVILDAVREKRRLKGPDGEDYFFATKDLIDSGHYRTFAKGWLSVLKSREGTTLFLQSLLLEHQPAATYQDAAGLYEREPEQVVEALKVITPDFITAAAIQLGWTPDDAAAGAKAVAEALAELFAQKIVDRSTTPERATA